MNPIYIDVEKVDGYKEKYVDAKILEAVRNTTDIDYTAVYNLKIAVLKKIFAEFSADKTSREYKKFAAYCVKAGVDLENLATYQALYSALHDKVYGGWRA